MLYSETIKARMLRRLVGPAAVSANVLARETGISQSTLSKWLREAGSVPAMSEKDKPPKSEPKESAPRRSQDWSTQDKLRALVETDALDEEALGEYLRRHGLHREVLDQWRADAQEALEGPRARRRRSAAEGKRIKELERELRKKEKALAETAALLVLRKKLNALWGDGDDDTDGKNEP
jgi:transposase-like protein